MITLQIKRTKKNVTEDNEYGNIVLAKGEQFAYYDDSYTQISKDSPNVLLFVGDGRTKLKDFYTAGKYSIISKYVTGDMIENGIITFESLDDSLRDRLILKDHLSVLDDYVESKLEIKQRDIEDYVDKVLDFSKVYSVTCTTQSDVGTKVVYVDNLPVYEDEEGNIDLERYNGLTLIVKFTNNQGNDNPMIKVISVNDGSQREIVTNPIYAGNSPMSGVYSWRANDTLVMTYSLTENRFNLSSTSIGRFISSWCADNDTTLINGAKIATGTIDAQSIRANSITANQIAIGAISAESFDPVIYEQLKYLSMSNNQGGASGTVVTKCESDSNKNVKQVFLNGNDALSIAVANGQPVVGTSLLVRFINKDTAFNSEELIYFSLNLDSIPFPRTENIELVYKHGDTIINLNAKDGDIIKAGMSVDDFNSYVRWKDGEVRTVTYDGTYWVLSQSTAYFKSLADWCDKNNQTWIGGGTIVSGTIIANQIVGGMINSDVVSLGNASGGFSSFTGKSPTSGSSVIETKGAIMYGSVDTDKEDSTAYDYSVIVTNKGTRLNTYYGVVGGWGDSWNISAPTLNIGTFSDSNRYGGNPRAVTNTINIGHNTATVNIKGVPYSTSDRNEKNSIEDLSGYKMRCDGIESIYKDLKPVAYTYNGSDKTHFGFIAQDVEESVSKFYDGDRDLALVTEADGVKSLCYNDIIALNTHMIKNIMSRLEEIEEKLIAVEADDE